MPTDSSDFKAWKGVTTNIEFLVRDNDRKPVSLIGKSLLATVIDPVTKNTKLQKELVIINDLRGIGRLVLGPTDIADWDDGLYTYSIRITNEDGTHNLLFLDQYQMATGTIDVKSGALPLIKEPQDMDPQIFTPVDFENDADVRYISSALVGDAQTGETDGLHTFAVYGTNFAGQLWVQASLLDAPTSIVTAPQSDWFYVQFAGEDFIEWTVDTPLDGVVSFNFQHSVNWVRFIWKPAALNEGTLDRILLVP